MANHVLIVIKNVRKNNIQWLSNVLRSQKNTNPNTPEVLRFANNDNEAETSDQPRALTRPSGKANSKTDSRRSVHYKYRLDELNEPPPRSPEIRSLLPLPGGGSTRQDDFESIYM